jgi:zinc D-Ala-D-Ala carboxypeptidase
VNLSPHFTLAEFTASDTALARRIDNTLPEELEGNARDTCEMMEKIRSRLLGCPVLISSGYRSPQLNEKVGGKRTSDHLRAMAVDFTCPSFGSPREVCLALVPALNEIEIGQLIYEGTWVHVSTRRPAAASNRVISIRHGVASLGIQE